MLVSPASQDLLAVVILDVTDDRKLNSSEVWGGL